MACWLLLWKCNNLRKMFETKPLCLSLFSLPYIYIYEMLYDYSIITNNKWKHSKDLGWQSPTQMILVQSVTSRSHSTTSISQTEFSTLRLYPTLIPILSLPSLQIARDVDTLLAKVPFTLTFQFFHICYVFLKLNSLGRRIESILPQKLCH